MAVLLPVSESPHQPTVALLFPSTDPQHRLKEKDSMMSVNEGFKRHLAYRYRQLNLNVQMISSLFWCEACRSDFFTHMHVMVCKTVGFSMQAELNEKIYYWNIIIIVFGWNIGISSPLPSPDPHHSKPPSPLGPPPTLPLQTYLNYVTPPREQNWTQHCVWTAYEWIH